MSNPVKKPVYLSASRIEVFQTCSALYAAKYLAKVPDPVGEPARRGSVAHDTLEILLNPRHDAVYQQAILHNTTREIPALWRVVKRFARKYDVDNETSLAMIDEFIMIALRNEFRGIHGTYKALPEQAFEVQVDRGDGRRWNAKGFIDQLFFVRDKTGEWLDIKDFKTGQMFKKDKLEYSVQALMYLLVSRHLYPQFNRRRFRFQFVKGKNQWAEFYATDEELNGFEWILSDLQRAMDVFMMENALDNPKAADGKGCWIYGAPCKMKDPVDYFALCDKDGNILASSFDETELKISKEGQTIQTKRWAGCPYYHGPKAVVRTAVPSKPYARRGGLS